MTVAAGTAEGSTKTTSRFPSPDDSRSMVRVQRAPLIEVAPRHPRERAIVEGAAEGLYIACQAIYDAAAGDVCEWKNVACPVYNKAFYHESFVPRKYARVVYRHHVARLHHCRWGAGRFSGLMRPLQLARRATATRDYTGRGTKALPIAIPNFVAGSPADGEVGAASPGSSNNNLKRAGVRGDRSGRLPSKKSSISTARAIQDGTTSNAQATLVTGTHEPARAMAAERLNSAGDVAAGQQLTAEILHLDGIGSGRAYHFQIRSTSASPAGERYFDRQTHTASVFVDESGSKGRRSSKRVALMDQDGANVRYLTRGGTDMVADAAVLAVTQEIHTYTEFGQGRPGRRLLFNIEDRAARDRRQFPGIVVLAALLADGQAAVI